MNSVPSFTKLSSIAFMAFIWVTSANGIEFPEDPYAYTWHELAPGVWSGVRENSPQMPVMGTSTFVIGDRGVIVYDGGGAPIMSDRLMAKVATLTDKPITHLVISHWHGDHMFGVFRIVETFPDVQVIAHPFTRAATLGRPMDYLEDQSTSIERYIPILTGRLEKSDQSEDKDTYHPDKMASVDIYYQAYFTKPLRSSAYRAAMGEVMVKLERDPEPEIADTETEQ